MLRDHLVDNVLRETVAASVPTNRDLTSDETSESNGLRDENSSTLLQFDLPLSFSSPDDALVTLLVLELLGLVLRNLHWLQVWDEYDLLVDRLLRVVSIEDFWLCGKDW